MRRSVINERGRLVVAEQRERAQAEARAVAEGVAETVALEHRRGAVFELAETDARGRERPYRRQPGLDWLARKGRITETQKKAGERYRDAYLVAAPVAAIASTLEVQPGMGDAGPSLAALVARADRRRAAEAKLALYRRQLAGHPALIAACDLVCGRELTPREAGGGERQGIRVEAVLLVALDLLAGG
jgi:hypothetical protein